ncbi:MAG: beta-propeller domain-containing protein, partial [Candidatus Anstonellaceae archaeon]
MKKVAFLVLVAVFFSLMLGCAAPPKPPKEAPPSPLPQETPKKPDLAGLSTFNSWEEVHDFLKATSPAQKATYMRDAISVSAQPEASKSLDSGSASSFSKTNVQVEGVDEADIVKNDGKFIYISSNDYSSIEIGPFYFQKQKGKISIIDAFPAHSMKKAGEIDIDGEVKEIFVYKDKLVAFASRYNEIPNPRTKPSCTRCIVPPFYYQTISIMNIYDI